MALRKIREFGDEVLNKECKEVTKMTIRTKVLIKDMLDTLVQFWNGDQLFLLYCILHLLQYGNSLSVFFIEDFYIF
jgi:hypothetical protein